MLAAFGQRVREVRRATGMNQEALSQAARLSRASIVNIERGRQGVSLATLYRLAHALGCPASSLLPQTPEIPDVDIAIGEASAASMTSIATVLSRVEQERAEHGTTPPDQSGERRTRRRVSG